MQIPEEFGQYLLLKKLTEDPLGETFRAGKVGRDGLERVVLLRVFNGRGLDAEGFAQRLGARTPVQQALRSPNIGSGVDVGRVRNYSYVAYDYISGKNLATLAAQATKARLPIPPDHALLIVERLALAVAVAYESRVEDERVLHGFVVPHLVMVSNEGETRLLGFEAAPGLREAAAAGAFGPEVTRYLAPEALTSAAVAKNDDVWSLAAILFELLTGEPLPAPPPGGYGALVDAATLAQEGGALAAPVAALLKKSLVPRAERVADVVSWHKALSKLMIDGQYSPTTFNLAFFMHNLFRDEIEREGQELQAERKLDLSERVVRAAHAPAAAAAAFDTREQTGVRQAPVREGTGVFTYGTAAAAAAPKRSKAPLWIGLAAALLLAAGAGGWLLFARDAGGKPGPREARNAAAPPVRPKAAAATPTQAQIQAQINAMIEQRSKEMEDKYRAQTDEQIRALQKQLEESRRAAASASLAKRRASRPRRGQRSARAQARGAHRRHRAGAERVGRRRDSGAGAAARGPRAGRRSRRRGRRRHHRAGVHRRRARACAGGAGGAGRRPGERRHRRHPAAAGERPAGGLPARRRALRQDRHGQRAGAGGRERQGDPGRADRQQGRLRLRRGRRGRGAPGELPGGHQGRRPGQDVAHAARRLQAAVTGRACTKR